MHALRYLDDMWCDADYVQDRRKAQGSDTRDIPWQSSNEASLDRIEVRSSLRNVLMDSNDGFWLDQCTVYRYGLNERTQVIPGRAKETGTQS